MNQVARMEPTREVSPLASAMTPMEMLHQAVTQGANVEVLEKLMALQERWQANQARQEFDAAVSAAKAEIPAIVRNRQGHNSKRYADFSAIARVVDPIITKHGLSYRFRTKQETAISVTCVLAHRSGHFEESTLCGPADTTGNKNAIQAIGSTLTYLQRYSLVQALGLAAADDDDASSGGGTAGTISDDQVKELSDLLMSTKSNLALFLKAIKLESLTQIGVDKFEAAKTLINETAKKRAEREAAQKDTKQ